MPVFVSCDAMRRAEHGGAVASIAKLRPGTAHRNGSEQMPRFQQLRRTDDNTEIDGNQGMFQS